MIKFEVGKVYRRLDKCFYGDLIKIMDIIEDTAIYKMDLTRTGDFKGGVFTAPIKVHDGYKNVEVMFTGISGQELMARADEEIHIETEKDEEPEANIEEVKEEDKEEEKKEELQKDSDDWIVEDEYEAICLETKQRFKVKLIDIDEDTNYALMFASNIHSLLSTDWFEDYKDVAISNTCGKECDKTVVVFKRGIESFLDWKEIKEEPREPVHFRVGNTYKGFNDEMFVCQTTFITTNSEKVGVFYNSKKDAILAQKIYSKNNVEYTYFMKTDQLDFIADEKYRDEIQGLV